jgi:hypothetical protein
MHVLISLEGKRNASVNMNSGEVVRSRLYNNVGYVFFA